MRSGQSDRRSSIATADIIAGDCYLVVTFTEKFVEAAVRLEKVEELRLLSRRRRRRRRRRLRGYRFIGNGRRADGQHRHSPGRDVQQLLMMLVTFGEILAARITAHRCRRLLMVMRRAEAGVEVRVAADADVSAAAAVAAVAAAAGAAETVVEPAGDEAGAANRRRATIIVGRDGRGHQRQIRAETLADLKTAETMNLGTQLEVGSIQRSIRLLQGALLFFYRKKYEFKNY